MLTFRYQNAMSSHIGAHGITDRDLERAVKAATPACRDIVRTRRKLGFCDLAYREDVFSRIELYARKARERFRNFVHIGIGGSGLGAIALSTSLLHRYHNERSKPRLYFLDNVDPEETADLFEHVDPEETLFHIVTKSGETTETVAGFLVALGKLGKKIRSRLVITTDRTSGFLRRFAKREGIRTFEIPESVGGRFSVMTPVGLLPAAIAGINIHELAAGGILAEGICARKDPLSNPAAMFALISQIMDSKFGRRIHVMMPYARALKDIGDWFRQLWAESLGKKYSLAGRQVFTGPTPVLSLGATDQHSQVQLYAEGPQDKLITFLSVENFRKETIIPPAVADPSADFLHGRRFSELITAELRGTVAALAAGGRPNLSIELPQVSARTIGGLIFFFEMATVFAGRFYAVNPFDQPGVEAGKKAAFALLGRPGYESQRAAIEQRLAPDERYVIR